MKKYYLLLISIILISVANAQTVVYVDASASGSNDGSSWNNAFVYLQDAMDIVNANGTTDYVVYTAAGVYYPDEDSNGDHTDNDQSESFQITYDNVKLYGGYPSGGGEQNSDLYITVLSGDIDNNDTNDDGNNICEDWNDIVGSNSLRVMILDATVNEEITASTEINGVMITGGNYDEEHWNIDNEGGSALYINGVGSSALPIISNCTFQGNQDMNYGVVYTALCIEGTAGGQFLNCDFIGNKELRDNGSGILVLGLVHENCRSEAICNGCRFMGNETNVGGTVYGYSSSSSSEVQHEFVNCLFAGNRSNGAGAYYHLVEPEVTVSGSRTVVFTNCTITDNKGSSEGGAIFIRDYTNTSLDVEMNNCIVMNTYQVGTSNYHDHPIRSQYIDIAISHSCVYEFSSKMNMGYTDEGGNLEVTPLFISSMNVADIPSADVGDYRVYHASVTVDAGDNSVIDLGEDIRGEDRIQDFTVDIGAYEWTPAPIAPTSIYVDASASGSNDGSSWNNAFVYLQDAMDIVNANGTTDYVVYTAAGVYYPDEDSNGDHTDNDQSESFQITYDNVKLYGGYPSGGGEQNSDLYITVLSGDIDNNDTNDDGNNICEDWNDIVGSNSLRVMILDATVNEEITASTEINGVMITGGNYNEEHWDIDYEGGSALYINGVGSSALPIISNCTFQGNQDMNCGVVCTVSCIEGTAGGQFLNCDFIGNKELRDNGSGILVLGYVHENCRSEAICNGCRFMGNETNVGGTVYGYSSSSSSEVQHEFVNCLFAGNRSNGAGAYYHLVEPEVTASGSRTVVFTNCTITDNKGSSEGGAIYIRDYTNTSLDVEMNNCIVMNTYQVGTSNYHDHPIRSQYIDIAISHSCVYEFSSKMNMGYTDEGGNLEVTPLFISSMNVADIPSADVGDYRVYHASVTVDAGDNSAIDLGEDIRGEYRIQDFTVDIGAYEWISGVDPYSEGDDPLPIELVGFNAFAENGYVELKWETASEIENAGFNIYRDGDLLATYCECEKLLGQGSVSSSTDYSFLDNTVKPGRSYSYYLEDVSLSGSKRAYNDFSAEVNMPKLDIISTESFDMQAVYPNPFNGKFVIPFTLKETQMVEHQLCDLTGRVIKNICSKKLTAGQYSFSVNADDMNSGMYLLRSVMGEEIHCQKIMLMK